MGQTIDPMGLMQRVTDRTLELIASADGVMVGVADVCGVTYVCGAGHQMSHLGTIAEPDSGLSGLAVQTGELQRSDDTASDPRVDAVACRRLALASLVCVPLRRADETLGVLAVNAARPHAFTNDDVAALTQLADFLSVVLGSAWDLARVKAQFLALTEPMGVPIYDTAAAVDSGHRIHEVLDDPQVLSMVFQPIIDLITNEIAAVEALARFDVTPYRPPDVWFTEAQDNGLGVEMEMLAIKQALARLPLLPENVALTINAGPQTVMSARFREAVLRAPTDHLVLELTEHNVIEDYLGLVASLRELRRSGLRVAVDDTGSGYSGLTHLFKLAPDFIKLDRELVNGIDVDPVRRALVASLVTFAVDTGAHIVAEGLENSDELKVLRGLGVRYAQGYHLGAPGPIEDLANRTRPPTASAVLNNTA